MREPVLRLPGQGETLHVLADRATFLAQAADSNGAFSLVELLLSPGGEVAPHTHPDAEEAIYALDGECAVLLGDAECRLPPGACAYVPGGVMHGIRNGSAEPARLLIVSVPAAGSAQLFIELAVGFAKGPGGSAALSETIGRIAEGRASGARPDPR